MRRKWRLLSPGLGMSFPPGVTASSGLAHRSPQGTSCVLGRPPHPTPPYLCAPGQIGKGYVRTHRMNTGQTQDELRARKASQGRQTAAGSRQVARCAGSTGPNSPCRPGAGETSQPTRSPLCLLHTSCCRASDPLITPDLLSCLSDPLITPGELASCPSDTPHCS